MDDQYGLLNFWISLLSTLDQGRVTLVYVHDNHVQYD